MKNPFKLISEKISAYLKEMREKNRKAKEEAIKSSFNIKERYGKLFIIHDGIAVMSFQPEEGIDVAIQCLYKMRLEAAVYEQGNTDNY